jgi:hypothetical protein
MAPLRIVLQEDFINVRIHHTDGRSWFAVWIEDADPYFIPEPERSCR